MDFFSKLAEGDIFSILVLCFVVLRVILGIVEAIGTRNISSVKKTIKELEKMLINYRLPNYQDVKGFDKSINKQEFSQTTPEFVYNEQTGELEKTGQFIDDKEKIQSFRSSSFEEILKKYLDSDIALAVAEKPVDLHYGESISKDDMAEFAKIIDTAENYRSKYNLPLELSPVEIFQEISRFADKNKKIIDDVTKLAKKPKQPSYEELLKLYGYKKEDDVNEKEKTD